MSESDVLQAGSEGPPPQHPETLINTNPNILIASFNMVLAFLASYGWFIVFAFILVMVLWSNFEKTFNQFFQRRKRRFDVTDNMTPEQVEARMLSMDEARRKMQENHDKQVRLRAEKLQQMEEEKRLQKISDHDALMAGKTQSGTKKKVEQKQAQAQAPAPTVIKRNKDAKPLRSSDYNPMSGTSSGSSSGDSFRWRPGSSRGPSGGG